MPTNRRVAASELCRRKAGAEKRNWKGRGGRKSGLEGASNFAAEKPRGAELSRETTRRGLNEPEAERRQLEADAKAGYKMNITNKNTIIQINLHFETIFFGWYSLEVKIEPNEIL